MEILQLLQQACCKASPGYFTADLKAAVLKQQTFKIQLQWEIAEQEITHELAWVKYGLSRDYGFLSHYIT